MYFFRRVADGFHTGGRRREGFVAHALCNGVEMGGAFGYFFFQEGPFAFRLQYARCGYYIIFGQGDRHIIAAKFRIKLAHVQVGHRMPAFIVINSRLGIPLRDLVGLPLAPQAGEGKGQLHPKRRADGNGRPGRQRAVQFQPGNIGILSIQGPLNGLAVHCERKAVDIAPISVVNKVKSGFAGAYLLAGKSRVVIPVGVGPEVEPQAVQCLRGVVVVGDGHLPAQEMRLVVECYADLVVYFLLKIVRLSLPCFLIKAQGKEKQQIAEGVYPSHIKLLDWQVLIFV